MPTDPLLAEMKRLTALVEAAFHTQLVEAVKKIIRTDKQVIVWNSMDGTKPTAAIASEAKMTPQAVNRIVAELQAAGLADRTDSGNPVRVLRLVLPLSGQSAMPEAKFQTES